MRSSRRWGFCVFLCFAMLDWGAQAVFYFIFIFFFTFCVFFFFLERSPDLLICVYYHSLIPPCASWRQFGLDLTDACMPSTEKFPDEPVLVTGTGQRLATRPIGSAISSRCSIVSPSSSPLDVVFRQGMHSIVYPYTCQICMSE